jgi:hypothetical protein
VKGLLRKWDRKHTEEGTNKERKGRNKKEIGKLNARKMEMNE